MSEPIRPYDESKKTKKPRFLLGVIIALAAVALGVFFLLKQFNSGEPYEYTSLVNTSRDVVLGKKDSSIQVVFFEDFACAVCARNHPDFLKTINTFEDSVAFVFKPVDILKSGSTEIGKAAYAAGKQNKFKEFTTLAYERQTDLKKNRDSTLLDIAKALSLDTQKWNEDRNFDKSIARTIEWNNEDAKRTVFPKVGDATEEKPNNVGIVSVPTVVALKDGKVVNWWNGFSDEATITTRINAILQPASTD